MLTQPTKCMLIDTSSKLMNFFLVLHRSFLSLCFGPVLVLYGANAKEKACQSINILQIKITCKHASSHLSLPLSLPPKALASLLLFTHMMSIRLFHSPPSSSPSPFSSSFVSLDFESLQGLNCKKGILVHAKGVKKRKER